jgi:5-methyltetrahydropteroyltriglutamate--homocysteine methyltransferase
LLRPQRLREARARHARGEISAAALRTIEDECIREVVALQEEIGFEAVTDGEFRRTFFHIDFLSRLEGVATDRESHRVNYRGERARFEYSVPIPVVTGKLRRRSSLPLEEFGFLNSTTRRTPKLCIPAPSMLHFMGGDRAIDRKAYPDLEEFFADLKRVYREELHALYTAGCRYVQIDDPYIAFLCDPAHRERIAARGDDPERLPALYADLIEGAIRDRPADMAVGVHLCRGNFSRGGAASGGYEAIAEQVFPRLSVDGFFLEFDDPRSGEFGPLACMPRGRKVVLGLVSTKTPAPESRADLERKLEQAARHVPIDSLCISPQCGFSSTHYGTELTTEEQAAKLRHVVELAAHLHGK